MKRSEGNWIARLSLSALIVFASASCGGQRDFRTQSFSNASPFTVPVTFTQINNLIIKPKCISCHSGDPEMSFETYAGVYRHVKPGNHKGSSLYEETDAGTMPPVSPSLTDDQVLAIAQWIDRGAPND